MKMVKYFLKNMENKAVSELFRLENDWGTCSRHLTKSRCPSYDYMIHSLALQWKVAATPVFRSLGRVYSPGPVGGYGKKVAQSQQQKAHLFVSFTAARDSTVVFSTLGFARTDTAARWPFPFLNAKAAGTSLYQFCFLTWYPLKEWVSSSVHLNAPGSKGQGRRLLGC